MDKNSDQPQQRKAEAIAGISYWEQHQMTPLPRDPPAPPARQSLLGTRYRGGSRIDRSAAESDSRDGLEITSRQSFHT